MIKPNLIEHRLRNDDKSALEEVYKTHKTAFINYALRYGLNREEIVDIYQDTVIVMYQNFVIKQTVLKNSSVKTYLFGIGKNLIFNRLKELKRLHKVSEIVEDYESISLETEELTTEQQKLRTHFTKMGSSCQEILKLFYYRNLTIKEIVEVSHYKDENTVKSHKSRCLKKLTALIHRENEGR